MFTRSVIHNVQTQQGTCAKGVFTHVTRIEPRLSMVSKKFGSIENMNEDQRLYSRTLHVKNSVYQHQIIGMESPEMLLQGDIFSVGGLNPTTEIVASFPHNSQPGRKLIA